MSKLTFIFAIVFINALVLVSCNKVENDLGEPKKEVFFEGHVTDVIEVIEYKYDWNIIADKIFYNENQAMTKEGIVEWMQGEGHLSAGIGHMIWYPEGAEEKYELCYSIFI